MWPSVPIVISISAPLTAVPDTFSEANLTAAFVALRCDYAAAAGLQLSIVGLPAGRSTVVAGGAALAANLAAAVDVANAATACPPLPPARRSRRAAAAAAAAEAAAASFDTRGHRRLAAATAPLLNLFVLISLVATNPSVVALGGVSGAMTAVLAAIAASPPATFVRLDAAWGAANGVASFAAAYGGPAAAVLSAAPGGAAIPTPAPSPGLTPQQTLGLGLGVGLGIVLVLVLAAACACRMRPGATAASSQILVIAVTPKADLL